MFIFSIIAVIIIFLLWKNTNVYGTKNDRWGNCSPDLSKGVPLEITWLHIIGLALLLIPIFNIVWFIVLLVWYMKRAFEDESVTYRDDIFYRPDGIRDFITNIYNILNKKI